MNKKFLLLSVIAFSHTTYAETQVSAGLGYQHGGLLGAQLSYIKNDNKYLAAMGLVGGSIGYQRILDSERKHSLGFTLGSEAITSEDGFAVISYNYYFSDIDSNGWILGVSGGIRQEDEGSFFANKGTTKSKGALSIELSYQF